ncbi:MAG: PspA-associated protein PspAA [Chloroflexota bacterium]
MIIRVQGSGQYRLQEDAVNGLNNLDGTLQEAVRKQDEHAVTSALFAMIDFVQTQGEPVSNDEVVPSDAILPPDTLTYDEIVAVLKEDGLIPG